MNKNIEFNNFTILIFIISLFVFQSYIPIVIEAISHNGSSDFQWKPATCAYNGVNHYRAYLNDHFSCAKFMTQHGEYLHGFYIILYPFTLLDWTTAKIFWFILNFFLLFLIIDLITKRFNIYGINKFIIILFSYYCIVTKIHFIMGQQALFILFFLTLPFLKKTKLNYFFSGLCYFKYNIGYAFFLYLIVTKNYKNFIISLIPAILGWFIYAYITKTSLYLNAFEPLLLMIENYKIITNDLDQIFLFTFLSNLTSNFNFNFMAKIVSIIMFSSFFLLKISKINDDLVKLSLITIVILSFVPHWNHDYILLIPFFILSIRDFSKSILHKINLILSIYFMHLHKAIFLYLVYFLNFLEINITYINIIGNIYPYANILLLIICLIFNLIIYKKTTKKLDDII